MLDLNPDPHLFCGAIACQFKFYIQQLSSRARRLCIQVDLVAVSVMGKQNLSKELTPVPYQINMIFKYC